MATHSQQVQLIQTTSTKRQGYSVHVTGVDDNLFIFSLFSAFNELLTDYRGGACVCLSRLKSKYEAAIKLFREDHQRLNENRSNIQVFCNTPDTIKVS